MTSICCLSGKKQSGKNTAVNYITARYLIRTNQVSDFRITDNGLFKCRMKFNGESSWVTIEEGDFNSFDFEGIKHYSFADPLKLFCIDVFGLTHEQCYGADEEKNSRVAIDWSNTPDVCGDAMIGFDRRGQMTARELLQYFGTNIIRKMLDNAWVNATINKIKREKPSLAIISDARFPNEINGVMEADGSTIRLLRNVAGKDEHPSEIALDDFPQSGYSFVIDNREHTISEQCTALDPVIDNFFQQISGGE